MTTHTRAPAEDLRDLAAARAPEAPTSTGQLVLPAVLGLVAVGGATTFGFWTGTGQRLLKFESALALSALGLALVPVALLVWRPRGTGDGAGGDGPSGNTPSSLPGMLRFTAALLSVAVGLVHLAVIREHAEESWLYGAFFVVVGLAQLAWALLVMRYPTRLLYWLAALGNAGIVVFFVITRTVGTLIGPEASDPARVGFGDVGSTVFEALIVAVLLVLLSGAGSRFAGRPQTAAGTASLVTLALVPQTALMLQSAVSSAPFVPHVG